MNKDLESPFFSLTCFFNAFGLLAFVHFAQTHDILAASSAPRLPAMTAYRIQSRLSLPR